MTLTLKEVKSNLTTVDFSKLPKPARNKGGQRSIIGTCVRYREQFQPLRHGRRRVKVVYSRGQRLRLHNLNTYYPKFLQTFHSIVLS